MPAHILPDHLVSTPQTPVRGVILALGGVLADSDPALAERSSGRTPALEAGVLSLFDLLDKRHVPRAILTCDEGAGSRAAFAAKALADRFDVLIRYDRSNSVASIGEALNEAARRIGVAPELCLFVASSEAEVRAALLIGLRVIRVGAEDSQVAHVKSGLGEVEEGAFAMKDTRDMLAVVSDHAIACDYLTRYAR
ncbi:hypothetical protein [Asaia sp. VD9]|uniref:hypothetical protein n=1 Tax=Asaia sp. VD9 TaxID=3081235 RepID=UPI003016FCB5